MTIKPAEEPEAAPAAEAAPTVAEEADAALPEAVPTEETPPGGFEHVIAAPVEEIVEKAAEEPAVAEEVTITPPSPVQEEAAREEAAQQAASQQAAKAEKAPEAGAVAETEAVETGEPAEEATFDELFTLRPEVITDAAPTEEEEEEAGKGGKKKGKKKGKKHVEIEFDPDAGRTIAKKKHKRGGEDWEW